MTKNYHFEYYFFLLTVLVLGIFVVWRLGPDKNLQMLAFMILSILYAVIGIAHHLLNHDLVGKIMIEYILVASLGVAASFFIFKGGFGI